MTCVCGCDQPLTGRQKRYASAGCGKRAARANWVLRVYGMTLADYDAILAHQGGRCGICRRAPKAGETFHVDHEHASGQAGPVRGILCSHCNVRLVGRLKSAERAQALADYLRDPPATAALGREVIAPGRPKKKRARRAPRKRTR